MMQYDTVWYGSIMVNWGYTRHATFNGNMMRNLGILGASYVQTQPHLNFEGTCKSPFHVRRENT